MSNTTTLICVVCPVGCPVHVEWDEENGITNVDHYKCKLALPFVEQELFDPRRTLTTSVPVTGGDAPLASVKTAEPMPKKLVMEAMKTIAGVHLTAPVKIGDVVIEDLAGTGIDLVATRHVAAA
ncbi:MAG: DUF1667 domain-containing protein [Dehalococcoidia bacterium]